MRTFDNFAVSESEDTNNSAAIPYHARENSLPFSYGYISANANNSLNATNRVEKSISFNLNNRRNVEESAAAAASEYTPIRNGSGNGNIETNKNMIKAQPRLTSPLLVRKTLNINNNNNGSYNSGNSSGRSSSRSPTRNTIANTYHYNSNSNCSGSSGNGFIENSKTPTRNELEDLLRDLRVRDLNYNKYNTTTTTTTTTTKMPPEPPKRRQQFLSSTPSLLQRPYNYDFEFNFDGLEDLQQPNNQRRANTMERSSNITQQYHTRDIPLERTNSLHQHQHSNYHTISSSSRPPATTLQQLQSQRMEQISRSNAAATYGNGNSSGFAAAAATAGHNSRDEIDFQRTATVGRNNNIYSYNNNDLSAPIYATSSKQMTKTNNQLLSAQPQQQRNQTDLSIADFQSSINTTTTTINTNQTTTPSPVGVRPETPAFPVTPRTPYGQQQTPVTPTGKSFSYNNANNGSNGHVLVTENIYQTNSRPYLHSSLSLSNSSEPQEVAPHLVKFAKDSSKFWYKPNLTREEAIQLLLHAAPGNFIVRDSTTYKNAYGLVLRVAQAPAGTASTGKLEDLVRHFLIEPTTLGVRLKGCANEPVFTSLSALVYEHSVNQLALPCLLRIPEQDLVQPLHEPTPAQKQLLTQGAACNVLWLYSCETESLTGEEAVRKAIRQLFALKPVPTPTEVQFKVTQQGITLTDNTRKMFFRKHYTADIISYCSIDPDHHTWTVYPERSSNGAAETELKPAIGGLKKTIFAFVARKSASSKDNQCHVFADLAINQPASAIVSFANKTLPTEKQHNYVL